MTSAAASLMAAGFLWMVLHGDLRTALPLFLLIAAAQFALLWLAVRRAAASPATLWGFAIVFRLLLLGMVPSLSDDIFRYAWEGRVQRAGENPYRLAPASPALAPLRSEIYESINHKELPTVYPPLMQAVFRAGTYVSDLLQSAGMRVLRAELLGQKLLFVFFDLLTLAAIVRWLRLRGLTEVRALWYAWNPLVILEVAGSGHGDSIGIFFLVLALVAWETGRNLRGAAAAAASAMSKYLAILLVPFLLWRKRWVETLLLVGSVALLVVPLVGVSGMAGARAFAERWEFNASLYALMAPFFENPINARLLAAGTLGAIAIVLGRQMNDLHRLSLALIASALFLMPVVHPWYVLWTVPFLCLWPAPGLLLWNATVLLSYLVWPRFLATGVWQVPVWVSVAEYAPVAGLMVWRLKKRVSP